MQKSPLFFSADYALVLFADTLPCGLAVKAKNLPAAAFKKKEAASEEAASSLVDRFRSYYFI